MASPKVRLLGQNKDVAVVTYIRLTQKSVEGGPAVTKAVEETRVWEKRKDSKAGWMHVHFHRSVPSAS